MDGHRTLTLINGIVDDLTEELVRLDSKYALPPRSQVKADVLERVESAIRFYFPTINRGYKADQRSRVAASNPFRPGGENVADQGVRAL